AHQLSPRVFGRPVLQPEINRVNKHEPITPQQEPSILAMPPKMGSPRNAFLPRVEIRRAHAPSPAPIRCTRRLSDTTRDRTNQLRAWRRFPSDGSAALVNRLPPPM